jgi:hypothetical protein
MKRSGAKETAFAMTVHPLPYFANSDSRHNFPHQFQQLAEV